jgi:P27 family predicted phage terminase small subunit
MSKSQRGPKPRVLKTVALSQSWEAAGRGLSSAARTAFNHAVDLLRQRGSLDATDVELVVAYAQTIEVRDSAYQQLQKDGAFVESDRGNVSAHPAARLHQSAALALKTLASEMGLSPASAKPTPVGQPSSGRDYWNAKLKLGGDD